MLITTNAVVLKAIAYSDTSLIVRLFTEDHGKVTVIAKGAKRSKSPFGSSLEPMNNLQVNYYHKETRDIQLLKETSLEQTLFNIRGNMTKITIGFAIIEIMDKTSRENDANHILFRLVTRIITSLEKSKGDDNHLFWFFLIQFAIRSGFRPNLEYCSRCRRPLSMVILDSNIGDLSCDSCLKSGDIILNQENLSFLKKLSITHLDEIEDLAGYEDTKSEIQSFLITFISYHLEGMNKVRSLEILEQINE